MSRVFVTGASRGIGRATALALARRGDDVVVAARTASLVAEVARACAAHGVRAQPLVLDVTDDDSVSDGVRAALSEGPIDVLINNAGIFDQTPFLAQDPAVRRREVEVNYLGAQRVTAAVLPSMLARGSGTVVNVSSLLGAIPCPTIANYSATKAALNAWSHALRGEVADRGVKIVVFLPSHTDTAQATETTAFDGVPALPVDYTVAQLLHALDRAPRQFAASPVFRTFLRLAGVFPGWAEGRMAATTRARLTAPSTLPRAGGSTR
jgi:short-subunit dehydrogenase